MILNDKVKDVLKCGLVVSVILGVGALCDHFVANKSYDKVKYFLITCNSVEDKNKNGNIDYPNEINGEKESFSSDEPLWLYFFADDVYEGRKLELVLSDSEGMKIDSVGGMSNERNFSAFFKYDDGSRLNGNYLLRGYVDERLVVEKRFSVFGR